ncbi:hypothetical protein COTS27_01026 [Spirochaetota bacterium]|nr:hypothetical protein COTS27_01026 [Spirochaetota bacterium]
MKKTVTGASPTSKTNEAPKPLSLRERKRRRHHNRSRVRSVNNGDSLDPKHPSHEFFTDPIKNFDSLDIDH